MEMGLCDIYDVSIVTVNSDDWYITLLHVGAVFHFSLGPKDMGCELKPDLKLKVDWNLFFTGTVY